MGFEEGDPAEGWVKKCPVDTFLARGRIPAFSDASGTDVDESVTPVSGTRPPLVRRVFCRSSAFGTSKCVGLDAYK